MLGDNSAVPPSAVYLGHSVKPELIHLPMASRHGLITGSTGSGSTVTLQGLAEGFSDRGVPVFCVDVRGDLSGLAAAGEPREWVEQRAQQLGYPLDYRSYPVIFWDLFGEEGLSLKVTVAGLDAFFVSHLLSAKRSQANLLDAVFRVAKEENRPLVRLGDLQKLVNRINASPARSSGKYGLVKGSLDQIAQSLLSLEMQGADHFIDEPAFRPSHLLRESRDGRGCINLLMAERHAASMQLYVTLQLFFLSNLILDLPLSEGRKPKLIFFFAGAEILFRDASEELLRKVEQILNGSSASGIGIYFLAPSLADIPDRILVHLGNRVVHGSHALTGAEQRSLTSNFRSNPRIDLRQALVQLETGMALVSTIDVDGSPTVIEPTLIKPPNSRVGALTDAERRAVIEANLRGDLHAEFGTPLDDHQALQDRILHLNRRQLDS